MFWEFMSELLISGPIYYIFFHMCSVSASRSSFSLVLFLSLSLSLSLRVYKSRVILRPETFLLQPQTGAQQREGDDVVWSFIVCMCVFVCVCRQRWCGGGGAILKSLSPVRECMLHCPGLTLRVCVCLCVSLCVCVREIGWVRALLLSLVLIKGAFELVSKTTSAVARDEKCLRTGGF